MTSPSNSGQAQGMHVTARFDFPTYRPGQRLWLTLEMTIDAGLHVYGQPIPEGFIPLTLDVVPLAGLVVEPPDFPVPTLHRLEGLDEDFYIYEGTITVAIPLTLAQAGGDTAVGVTVGYQACSDTLGCFMPQKIEIQLPIRAMD